MRHVVPVRDPFVEAGRNSSRPRSGARLFVLTRHSSLATVFPLATAFRFLATRHCSSHSMVGDVAEGPPPSALHDTQERCTFRAMKELMSLALLTIISAAPTFSQVVTTDRMPANSGCHAPFTYPSGINLRVSVRSNKNDTEAALERTLALDISRFKDTGEIQTQHDRIAPIGQRPIGFELKVFWAEVTTDGKTVGYEASMFLTETCAVFEPGFSSQLLIVAGPYIMSTKEKLQDMIEKDIYDSLEKIVKQRRNPAKT